MLILRPLKHRPVVWIWGGQVLSAVGDEIHKVALVWLAAGLIGNNTGYLSAIQAASIFLFSLLGGAFADSWDHRRTMITADILRGLAVLAIPVSIAYIGPNLAVLAVASIVVSGLTAFFDPALKGYLPQLVRERETLHAANGLMETTGRLGRIFGPGIVGLINNAISVVHFFYLDALSFFVSAWAVSRAPHIPSEHRHEAQGHSWASVTKGIWSGVDAIKGDRLVQFLTYTNGPVNASWYIVFPLTLGLYLHDKMPENIGALGLIVSAYGVGNVLSNLVVANFPLTNAVPWGFFGRILVGVGFLGLAVAPTLPWMMASAALAATGGPMTDLSFLAVVQRSYDSRAISKIFRLNLTISYGILLLVLLLSPKIFALYSYPAVIAASGATMALVGVIGFLLFWNVKR
ncbi:MAG TPA: MFS transporter [Bdellovibrionales bacterium]|nr:MFS transporter [Bdellovibrionales bacterium]